MAKRKVALTNDEPLIVETFDIVEINIFPVKKKYTVIGIRGNSLVVTDEKGNGFMFVTPEKYKEVKIGYTVLL